MWSPIQGLILTQLSEHKIALYKRINKYTKNLNIAHSMKLPRRSFEQMKLNFVIIPRRNSYPGGRFILTQRERTLHSWSNAWNCCKQCWKFPGRSRGDAETWSNLRNIRAEGIVSVARSICRAKRRVARCCLNGGHKVALSSRRSARNEQRGS